jgi:zinc finger protein
VPERVVCPVCQNDSFTTRMEKLEIAYFDEVIQLTYACEGCGFRRTDLHITQEEEPKRYRLEVASPEDLSARVVRSATGHFEVPELDIRAEPGQAADSFVTNAEGVLDRCINALETALRGIESEEKRERAERLLQRADRLREVEETWTIVLQDPLGNSAILGDRVEETRLSEEEAEELGVPYPVVDLDDADPVER